MLLLFVVGCLLNLLLHVIWRSHHPQQRNRTKRKWGTRLICGHLDGHLDREYVLQRKANYTAKVNSASGQVGRTASTYPGSCSMKRLGIFLLPPRWDTGLLQGYRQYWLRLYMYKFIHLIEERPVVRVVSCTRTQRNVLEFRPLGPESTALTMRPPRASITLFGTWYINHDLESKSLRINRSAQRGVKRRLILGGGNLLQRLKIRNVRRQWLWFGTAWVWIAYKLRPFQYEMIINQEIWSPSLYNKRKSFLVSWVHACEACTQRVSILGSGIK